ncbi:hypothetical protein ACVW1E_000659 [Ewingella americana]
MFETNTPEQNLSDMTAQPTPQPADAVNTVKPDAAKINLLDLNRKQMREFFNQHGRKTVPC